MKNKDVFMHVKELGDLFLYDVLLSHVYPRVFVCEDEYDSKYLFYEVDGNDDKDVWVVAKITKKEYYSLVDRKKTIQKVYDKKDVFSLFSITKSYGEDKDIIELKNDGKEWLLSLPKNPVYAEKEVFDDVIDETLEAARETGTTTFDIRIFPGTNRHSVPQNVLAELCSAMTSLTNSVFGNKRSEPLNVATAPGSCIIRFSFPDQVNLFGETDADNQLSVINSILSSESISEGLEKVKDQEKFIRAYSKILDSIRKTNSDVQFTTASPNSTEVKKVELSSRLVKSRFDYVKDIHDVKNENINIIGTLIALDIKAKRFKLQLEDGSIKTGFIMDEYLDKEIFELPKVYNANIIIEKYYGANKSAVKEKYCLKNLSLVEE